MGKYLKKFNSHAEYNAFTATTAFILPNVSLCVNEDDLHYNPLVRVSGVTLDKSELSIKEGDTETLVASVLPYNASNKNVTWSSSDDSIATVSSNGVVTAIGDSGNTNITVTTIDGGYTAQCAINIAQTIDGHEYVDLGLPSGTKWAKMNVGASSETEYGNYYQYGKGSAQYAATSGQSYYRGSENPLSRNVDTATQVMGEHWCMPTKAQCEELIANTTSEWTTINGVNGYKFTATNGNYVFFPAASYWDNGSLKPVGNSGHYWSSAPSGDNTARYLFFNSGNVSASSSALRTCGCSVRGVVG